MVAFFLDILLNVVIFNIYFWDARELKFHSFSVKYFWQAYKEVIGKGPSIMTKTRCCLALRLEYRMLLSDISFLSDSSTMGPRCEHDEGTITAYWKHDQMLHVEMIQARCEHSGDWRRREWLVTSKTYQPYMWWWRSIVQITIKGEVHIKGLRRQFVVEVSANPKGSQVH